MTVIDYAAEGRVIRSDPADAEKTLMALTDTGMAVALTYEGPVTDTVARVAELLASHGAIVNLRINHARNCDAWLDPTSFAPPKGGACTCGIATDFDEASAALIRT